MIDVPAGGTVDRMVFVAPDEIVVDKAAKQIYLHRKVFFEFDRAELKVDSLTVLDELVRVLNEHPEIRKLRIEGHTDTQGADAYNLKLSEERAAAVVTYLVEQGVARDRLVSQGFGEGRPLQQGTSEDVHATNRRVECHILELAE
jgi:OOP family OmpA-OmpF porin